MADWTFEFHSNVSDVLAHKAAATARALEKMGGRAETHAKEICPVGTPESTGIPGYIGGTLKNSITHKKQDSETMLVGTNVQYAPYVELGTYKMKAKPYLRPAVENHVSEYREIVEKEFRNA